MSRDESHLSGTLEARELSLAYEGKSDAVRRLSLAIVPGRITVIAGPNGCGKSTLLRGLARLLAPASGSVILDGAAIHHLPTQQVARRIGMLPQGPVAPEGLLVRKLAAMGRYPYQRWWQTESAMDAAIVERALVTAGVAHLATRPVETLSGGERQRAWLAMAIAQQTPILLLDEPTTFLDIGHQLELMELITQLNRREGYTIVPVLHDLNQAAALAHTLVLMKQGEIAAQGTPFEVMQEDTIARVFGVRSHIVPHPLTGKPLCLPVEVVR